MRTPFTGALCALLIASTSPVTADSCDPNSHPIPLSGVTCGPLNPPHLSCAMLPDVEGELQQSNLNTVQRATDIFAWQDFIALNWPAAAGQRGVPDAGAPIEAPGPRVWESWKEQYEVYLPDGSAPPAWNEYRNLPKSCGETATKMLFRDEKADDIVDATQQAVKADGTLPATLTDQDGKLVRYEIRMNRPLFESIVANKWYNGQVQAEADSIDFPGGSMLVKAAWREFSDEQVQEIGDRFLTRETCFCESPEMKSCHVATAALVGLHVMHKTPSAPQWIWETFEHVANVEPSHGLPASFFNPECTGDHCAPNSQTYTPTPNQVTRLLPIPDANPDCSSTAAAVDNVVQLNGDVMTALAKSGSVLTNYQLVAAQWPMQRPDPGNVDTVFSVLPTHSANTTMETFAQETSSCMGCHVMSRSLKPDVFVSGDFSFTLNNARPFPEGAVCSKYGDSNSESCDDRMIIFDGINNGKYTPEQWQQIKRGYMLSEHTFEMIPKPYVNNRLHCGSCHLHTGGDPDAAWWVDMDKVYSPVEKLQARINSCFNHSMNGQSICEPASDGSPGTCNTNQDMNAIIAYMGWLTDEYHAGHKEPPPRGYPKMESQPQGDPQRGADIFAQKCAFCHNADGQGRYESDTYFRPALWGDDSYNESAGMSTPSTFAAFIKSNMPYGSGGLLTDQEAMDIGCYVDAQLRPGQTDPGDPSGSDCKAALK